MNKPSDWSKTPIFDTNNATPFPFTTHEPGNTEEHTVVHAPTHGGMIAVIDTATAAAVAANVTTRIIMQQPTADDIAKAYVLSREIGSIKAP